VEITDRDVRVAMSQLSNRDEHLVELRFWNGKTWEQIADLMGFPHAAEAEAHWDNVVAPQLRADIQEMTQ
jgi:hypothetical protein